MTGFLCNAFLCKHIPRLTYILILLFALSIPYVRGQSPNIQISGEQKKWHPITLTLDGPSASETSNPSPFLDHRFNVTFSKGGKSIVVPGYFAADGDAANTSATSGNKWRARFVPDETGTWTYTTSFRTGAGVAVDDSPTAGTPNEFDGLTGTFTVAGTDKTGKDFRARGVLRQVGEHYLLFDSGEWFITSGAGSPETFLAYAGFDNTFSTGAWIPKSYAAHIGDWNAGDPVWAGDKGKGIIGAINYLSGAGVNGMFMLVMNTQGDGKDTFPWTAHEDFYHFDVSKLAQWGIVFDHMNRKGIMPQLVLQEMDIEHLLDNGELGETRKLFYRELMARFNHLNGITWNIGEEHRAPELGGNTNQQRLDFVGYLADLEQYGHPIVMHTSAGEDNYNNLYGPFLGNQGFGGMSYHIHGLFESNIDTGGGLNTYRYARAWRENSANSGHKWIITLDECCGWNTGVRPDQSNLDAVRIDEMWGTLMAGASGFNWYLGFDTDHRDLTLEDFRRYDFLWETSSNAANFFRENLSFVDMAPLDGLTSADSIHVFGKQGEAYVVHLRTGGTTTLDLKSYNDTFNVLWYNPRMGGELVSGSTLQVTGPGVKSIGFPPFETDQDWVALVRTGEIENTLTARFSAEPAGEPFVMSLDASTSTSTGTTIVSYNWDFGDGASGTGKQTNHTYSDIGFYTVVLTITDSQGNTSVTSQTIEVKHPSATGPYFEENGLLVIEAENYETAIPRSAQAWVLDRETAGFEGSGSMAVLPDIGGFYGTSYSGFSPEIGFHAVFEKTGTYYVWLRVFALNLDGNSVHVGLDGVEVSTAQALETNTLNNWVWMRSRKTDGGNASMQVNAVGDHVINLWAREDGLYVDRVLLTTDPNYIPAAGGPDESHREGEIPVATMTATPTSGLESLTVSFDASASSVPLGYTATYTWDFGDGTTGAGVQASHTYISAGAYPATLTVASSNGLSDETSVQIDVQSSEPIASFSAEPVSGVAPLAVSFDASTSLAPEGITIDAYNWDFGDGSDGTGETTNHTYATSGDYQAILTIVGSNGKTDADTMLIQVIPPDPVAVIVATPIEGMAPLAVDFDGTGSTAPEDKAITGYAWDFGDGDIESGATVSHVYVDAGDYTVTLTVTDENGNADEEAIQIQVTPRPESHELHIIAINLQTEQGADQMYVTQASITINDEHDLPVAGVLVGGLFSGDVAGEGTDVTDAMGVAHIASNAVATMPASAGFCVNSVTYAGLIYEPAQNADPAFECVPSSGVGAEDPSEIPVAYSISNYPNPFHKTTTFLLEMPAAGYVSLKVFNVLGQEVVELADGQKSAGVHRITLDAGSLSPGIYIYTLETEGYRDSRKMVLR